MTDGVEIEGTAVRFSDCFWQKGIDCRKGISDPRRRSETKEGSIGRNVDSGPIV